MKLPPLTIIPAGAGSGKTYRLQHQLGEWIETGQVSPERIVAVTFTNAAATELNQRIRARLMELGRMEDALRLDRSYISTIHAFGQRLITEYAFDLGQSPAPRLLNENEERTLLRFSLANTRLADTVVGDLNRYGYTYNKLFEKTAEEMFEGHFLRIIQLLRSMGHPRKGAGSLVEKAASWIQENFGQTENGELLNTALRHSVEKLLKKFPNNLAPTFGNTKTAREDLERDHRNLYRARDGNQLENDWELWQSLQRMRLSKRGAPMPEKYEKLANEVITNAHHLSRHSGLLDQAIRHCKALVGAAEEALDFYGESKRQSGLLDYTDMVATACHLVSKHPEILQSLAQRMDCLLIDEFQDTNPLQFALLWTFKEAGVPTLIVGDTKQAIMGFQNADPRLMEQIERQYSSVCQPLMTNWRAQPSLMNFINALGRGLFNEAYTVLKPQGPTSDLDPLEAITFGESLHQKQFSAVIIRASHVAARIRNLLNGNENQIIDRYTKNKRQLQGSDIAVLCPTNNMLAAYADVLTSFGLKVQLDKKGWQTTREIQIMLAALAHIADPKDVHPRLYLAVTELGSKNLEQALGAILEGNIIDDPILEKLKDLETLALTLSVPDLIAATCEALNIHGVISRWPNAAQARANLLRLQSRARQFVTCKHEALASGGYYGSGISTFLAWLETLDGYDDKQPTPRVVDENAVQLVTWHASKGKEWPVTVVSGLDWHIKASLPHDGIEYDHFKHLDRLLDVAQLRFIPGFADDRVRDRFLDPLQKTAEIEHRRLLYVALTRARDKLILEWPSYTEKSKAQTPFSWTILNQSGLNLGKNFFKISEEEFKCLVITGGDTAHPDYDPKKNDIEENLSQVGRRALKAKKASPESPLDTMAVTALQEGILSWPGTKVAMHPCGPGLHLDLDLDAMKLGTLMHRCFELLGENIDLKENLPLLTGHTLDSGTIQTIAQAVTNFETWLRNHFTIQRLGREISVQCTDPDGTLLTGIIDLLLETPEGLWIVDHKTDAVTDFKAGMKHHWPQLSAYVHALTGQTDRPVRGVAIYWIRAGVFSLLRLE
ncbi:MAG: UvrD-helicase domain-containing protein [Magnetococcales bacterium]|nr:UvrD-helicase domain-containing protein [Magnetococcales bacterium]